MTTISFEKGLIVQTIFVNGYSDTIMFRVFNIVTVEKYIYKGSFEIISLKMYSARSS